MDSEQASSIATDDARSNDMYYVLGGTDACRRLAVAFYAHVEREPILRSLYPPTFKCPIDVLTAFFIQFFGGPHEYAPLRWSLSLREAHLRFRIGQRERDAWLKAMFAAIEEVSIEESVRSALRWYFAHASTFLINQPPEAANESRLLLERSTEGLNDLETSLIHQDIAQRWQAQRTLEETIALVRRGSADEVLTLLASPVIQTYFANDRAALLSMLAILSSSNQPSLLDYIEQVLVGTPDLVEEHYTYGCTLLHEVASQGSPACVELLLHLGADPDAPDRLGRTPLYYVGNATHSKDGAENVHLLAKWGANVNAQEKMKLCSALHMAARRGNVPVGEALLDCEADIEARDKAGDTPLLRAVKCGKAEMASFLLSRGANIHIQGKNGLTPQQVARGKLMKQVLQVVRE